jgi:hypothetical protein
MGREIAWIWVACAFLVCVSSADAADYVTAKKCRMCHMKQYKSWEQTRMAKAFDLLKPGVAAESKTAAGLDADKNYTADASCTGCHAVNGSPEMPGVQCEACHGPGSDYLKIMMTNRDYKKEELLAKGLTNPTETVCTRCHNEKSPFFKGFNFNKSLKKGVHEHFPLKRQH